MLHNLQANITPILSLSNMKQNCSKEVDRLMININRLVTDAVFADEIERLSEIVTPTEEEIIQVEKEIRKFM